jgi:hypothetical protein
VRNNPPVTIPNANVAGFGGTKGTLVDLKVYNPQPPMGPKKDKPMYASPFPYHIPAGGPYYPMGKMLEPLMYPMINNYNISTADPNMDFAKVNMVFEDVLPIKENQETSVTIAERQNMLNFVRGVLVRKNDGEMISLNGKDRGSLLSYLKFMELNPYHTHPYFNNIFKSLPDDFLIYRTAYPVRFSPESGSLICANPSIGINVRIYKLNMAEAKVKITNGHNYYNHDVWREIAYYEYIREKIFKTKTCPNFVVLFSYYISENQTIDFDKVNRIRNGGNVNANIYSSKSQPKYIMTDKSKQLIANRTLADKIQQISAPLPNVQAAINAQNAFNKLNQPSVGNDPNPKINSINRQIDDINIQISALNPATTQNINVNKLKDAVSGMNTALGQQTALTYDIEGNPIVEMEINPLADSGKILIALTEAPTQSLIQWTSKQYQKDVNIRKMINQGCYSEGIWMSILFQLLSGLHILKQENIFIRNMTIKDSIFIKDLKMESYSSGWWRYRIDGLDYNIPNYGYLLQIDTPYKDVPVNNSMVNFADRTQTKQYKIYARMYSEDASVLEHGSGAFMSDDDLQKANHASFCSLINVNNFGREFANLGGIKPPENILKIIGKIYDEASRSHYTTPISTYIYKYMKNFVNNRVGTFLLKKELENVLFMGNKDFGKGDMVVYSMNDGNYDQLRWALYVDSKTIQDDDLGSKEVAIILTKEKHESKEITEKEVPKELLYSYNKGEKIDSILKPQEPKYSEEDLLETYIIDKNIV